MQGTDVKKTIEEEDDPKYLESKKGLIFNESSQGKENGVTKDHKFQKIPEKSYVNNANWKIEYKEKSGYMG